MRSISSISSCLNGGGQITFHVGMQAGGHKCWAVALGAGAAELSLSSIQFSGKTFCRQFLFFVHKSNIISCFSFHTGKIIALRK
jgi:hypothetical protein